MSPSGRSRRGNEQFRQILEKQRVAKALRAQQSTSKLQPVGALPSLSTRALNNSGHSVYWFDDDPERYYNFWLVQRLNRTRSSRSWFGNKFELDYMGSSEFEFGATHDSLDRMHKIGDFQLQAIHITRKGMTRTVFCIAPSLCMERKLAAFTAWASQDYPRSKEWTNFDALFDENFQVTSREYIDTVAWWSLDVDILWTLDLTVAEQLLYGLQNPAK